MSIELINFNFQGYVNGKYIVKGTINKLTSLQEAETLDKAKVKVAEELLAKNKNLNSDKVKKTKSKRKVLSSGVI